jgi:hypothetical protein
MELETGKTPQALLDKPVLYGVASEIAQAYNVLASRRTSGMMPNPINLSEILAFIQIYGHPNISIDRFVELIGVADMQYLELFSGNRSKRPG